MNTVALKDKIDKFYNDINNLIRKRNQENVNKINKHIEEEKKLSEEIQKIENHIEEIKNNPGYHINKKLEYNLIPDAYKRVDELKKEIEYKNYDLENMRLEHEEERNELLKENQKNYDNYSKYIKERIDIISCIEDKEKFDRLNYMRVQEDQLRQLREINDRILERYLPNEAPGITNAAPPTIQGSLNLIRFQQ